MATELEDVFVRFEMQQLIIFISSFLSKGSLPWFEG